MRGSHDRSSWFALLARYFKKKVLTNHSGWWNSYELVRYFEIVQDSEKAGTIGW